MIKGVQMSKPVVSHFRNAENTVAYTAGDMIFSAGDPDDKMYAVKSGKVDIMFNGSVFETVGEGGILGEKSILDDTPHTTTAIARTDCEIVPVDEHHFLFLVHETPTFALQVMRIMANRTRKMMQAML
jgi:CRP-like cAMP-binding protein